MSAALPTALNITTPPSSSTTPTADTHITNKPLDPPKGFYDRILAFERGLIDEALTTGQGHQGKAAKHLGMTYHAFRGLLRKHGLKK